MGGGGTLLLAALVTGLAIIAWVLGNMLPFFLVLRVAGLFRVAEHEEKLGCDRGHGMGYDNVEEVANSTADRGTLIAANARCGATRPYTLVP